MFLYTKKKSMLYDLENKKKKELGFLLLDFNDFIFIVHKEIDLRIVILYAIKENIYLQIQELKCFKYD